MGALKVLIAGMSQSGASSLGGGIGGTTGTTDNAITRADGTGGSTLQSSNIAISDPATGVITLSMIGPNGLLVTTNSNSDIVFAPDGSGNVNVKTTTGQMLFGSTSTGLGAIFNLDANIYGAGGRLYRFISGGSATGPGPGAWASQFIIRDEAGSQNVIVYDGGNTGQLILSPGGNTLALRNGANAQTLNVYNTFTDASNYEAAKFGWVANDFYFQINNAGTGSDRSLKIGTFGAGTVSLRTNHTDRWIITGGGDFTAGTDNAFDIGGTGAKPRTIYAATSVLAPNIPVADTGWTANADSGTKTAIIGSSASNATIGTALDIVTAGAGTLLKNTAEKVKALEAALVALLFPNA